MGETVQLYIDGMWRDGATRETTDFWDPATGATAGAVAVATSKDLEEACSAADKGFRLWRAKSAVERSALLRKASALIRERSAVIAPLLTREQGKPLAQARQEVESSADIFEWFAEEGRRVYGRIIPSRAPDVRLSVTREPVGPVASFSPWNFPLAQAARKIGAALASGCSVILKGPEEAPEALARIVGALHDAGIPAGVLNLVYGVPSEISSFLIPHPAIRKISFTGSTVVGKQLAAMAGAHMKRATMELGGHSPTLVFEDANLERAADLLTAFKFRNAGQVCTSPARILIQDKVYGEFKSKLVERAARLKTGNGSDPGTEMGPLANPRRVQAMEAFVQDATDRNASVATGGRRIGNQGNFFEPTILEDVPQPARIMNEEPFGPIMTLQRFADFDSMVEEANRLPYGLAAYAYTRSARTAAMVSDAMESGMVSINHHGLGLPETPFGGVKDSGYGSEGGSEAMEPYLVSKFVTHSLAD
ncbi:NAD-dependent succinate-semialdehyde dehydrogenase [Mesorhizobium sp. BR1-1-2]|uniref:NAD-dependent succinate-semialdehyde dehydrogenase n=1 Tax=Mesorhizobium sp. BR1-1-2 TaxID=2876652 RepID=UPI001CCABEB2|nr:NAD-dependent succinate-semialdehyde dehydrogenase [Mesorhizobium sp. BR1-1-2]MBZ9964645.1 NAD-dependent succinate-semialdehyde dehydrogenase [Mesorhizobium sp. BR1-1-2]